MPELPEVEIFRRLVDDHCVGQVIVRAAVLDPAMVEGTSANEMARRLAGKTCEGARRHGKYLLVAMAGHGALVLYFGTNGFLQLLAGDAPEPSATRLRLDFRHGDRLAYVNPRRLGGMSLAESAEALIAAKGLGPDVLSAGFDLDVFTRALAGRQRDVKSVLMDQALMSGIGNLYSDEILFQAGLHPFARAGALGAATVKRLFGAMKSVLETSIARGAGSERGREQLPSGFLLPQRRRDGHCPRCHAPLATTKHEGRTSYFCPRCQPGPAQSPGALRKE